MPLNIDSIKKMEKKKGKTVASGTTAYETNGSKKITSKTTKYEEADTTPTYDLGFEV